MQHTALRLTRLDHGRPMTLDEFEAARDPNEPWCELGRGRAVFIDVPGPVHLLQVNAIRDQLFAYRTAHPGVIHGISGGDEARIALSAFQSERHPDVAVYMTPPSEEVDVWAGWVPELVVEVVAPGSEERDYTEKREEYLAFGVCEYWIIDAARQQILILTRSRGQWAERALHAGDSYRTRLLPGIEFAVPRIPG